MCSHEEGAQGGGASHGDATARCVCPKGHRGTGPVAHASCPALDGRTFEPSSPFEGSKPRPTPIPE